MSSEALPLELLPLIIDNKPFISADAVTKSTYSTHLKADFVQYISATAADAIAAVDSSQRAFKSWSTSLPSTRRAILQRTAALLSEDLEQLVKLQVNETNCTEMWATNNVRWAAAHLEEVAGKITSALKGDIPVIQTQGQTALVYKRAIGPVLSIPPWNASIFLACRAVDQPLAVGCTVVLKASELSVKTHHYLAGLFHRAGLPAGVLNVIQARREDASIVTEALIAHPGIRKIEFIGSAPVGRAIGALAGKHLKPILMELGGKAAALVLDDADLELAANGCVIGAFTHSGQVCFSTERVIINSAVVEKFIVLLKEAAAKFQGSGRVSVAGTRAALSMQEDAVAKGAKIIYGEVKLLDEAILHPLILSGVTSEMQIYDKESFGPVLAVYEVDSDEEAIELANNSRSGLSAGIYSKDITRALTIASKIEVGQTHINFPFGTGWEESTFTIGMCKESGYGKQNGDYGLDEFLDLRAVLITNPPEFFHGMATST